MSSKKYKLIERGLLFDDEVTHPCDIQYRDRRTKEVLIDLHNPDNPKDPPPQCGVLVADLVLSAHVAERPTAEHVPCYKDGNVENVMATNLFWGLPDDPKSGKSLANANQS